MFAAMGKRNAAKKQEKMAMGKPPYLLKYRSSTAFIAFAVGIGVLVDLAGYGLVVPVIPFRLQALGYTSIGSRTGWLVSAYAGGLILSSPPIAWLGASTKARRWPLLFFLCFMAGAIVLFMETASYTWLVVSRVLQGVSGTGIWTLGMALVSDSVPEERIGAVMGWVMVGYSVGQLIGPPVGGVLYARMGYKAPFVFALCLIFVDFALRLLIIEKHEALPWVEAGLVDYPNFEMCGYTAPEKRSRSEREEALNVAEVTKGDAQGSLPGNPSVDPDAATTGDAKGKNMELVKEHTSSSVVGEKKSSAWPALIRMVTEGRPVTLFLLTGLVGVVLGALLDTGMTLWLQHQYGLTSLGAGLVFIGAVVPSFVASPIAGIISDKYGAKMIGSVGILISVPAYALLIIAGPLPLFVFFLVLVGFALSFVLTPVIQDLSLVVSKTPGLGSAHVYGCFNMMYSVGSFIGPIIGGQIIQGLEIKRGWAALCGISSGLSLLILPLCIIYMGGPLSRNTQSRGSGTGSDIALEEARGNNGPSSGSEDVTGVPTIAAPQLTSSSSSSRDR